MRDCRFTVALVFLALAACGNAAVPMPEPRPAPIVDDAAIQRAAGETPQWWFRAGARTAATLRGAHAGKAKNVILFLGDGMSLTTITAARILEGQRAGAGGEEHRLAFEEFPYTALSRTYEVDAQIPEWPAR